MTAQDDVIEALHRAVDLELELASVFLTELLCSLHRAHLVDPVGHSLQSLVVSWHVWIILQCLLHITKRWQQLINRSDVQSENISRRNELGRDVEDALGQVSVCFFASVVRLACFQERLG